MGSVNRWILPPGAGGGSKWTIELEAAGWTGTVTLVSRAAGTSDAFKPIPYTSLHLNGVAGTGLPVSTAFSAGSSLIQVGAESQEIALDQTVQTGGTLVGNFRFTKTSK